MYINFSIIEPVQDGPSARFVAICLCRVDEPNEHHERPGRGVPPVHDADIVLLVGTSLGGGAAGCGLVGLLGLAANSCEYRAIR